jgi:hypothetical protein
MGTRLFPATSGGHSHRPRFDDSVSQLIRSAERFMSQRKYSSAREQLSVARSIDPRNTYIDAILDRLAALEQPVSAHTVAHDTSRYLSVSVGPEFADGIRSNEPVLPAGELLTRVRQLTNMAERLLESGSPESAFDTLMKAYMLDPVSPYVASCEKTVLPAWRQLRAYPSSSQQEETVNISHTSPPPAQEQSEQAKRLETLKLQKEMERRESERAVWREASSPPTVFGIADGTQDRNTGTGAAAHNEDQSLFSKLKRGKFLNK